MVTGQKITDSRTLSATRLQLLPPSIIFTSHIFEILPFGKGILAHTYRFYNPYFLNKKQGALSAPCR